MVAAGAVLAVEALGWAPAAASAPGLGRRLEEVLAPVTVSEPVQPPVHCLRRRTQAILRRSRSKD